MSLSLSVQTLFSLFDNQLRVVVGESASTLGSYLLTDYMFYAQVAQLKTFT